jgi:cytidylate kinase
VAAPGIGDVLAGKGSTITQAVADATAWVILSTGWLYSMVLRLRYLSYDTVGADPEEIEVLFSIEEIVLKDRITIKK